MGEAEHRTQVNNLSSNVDKIVSYCNSLIETNTKLTKEIENLNIELNIKKEKLIEIEKRYNDLKLAQAFSSPSLEGNKEAKQKINKIIREIESCITLLKK
jgi:chromosome segregation ATPase